MSSRCQTVVISLVCVAFLGCARDADRGPFGTANDSHLLSPFSGEWTCDFEKTLDAHRAAGKTDEEINGLRKLREENPQSIYLHPDMTITGDVAVCAGDLMSEYRFYSMHEHGHKVCGKAWHHEDRFDPGDMSKCYVRLMLKDADLYMEVRMCDGSPEMNDPDIATLPPTEGGSVDECDADHPRGDDWSDWTTFVFSRRPSARD